MLTRARDERSAHFVPVYVLLFVSAFVFVFAPCTYTSFRGQLPPALTNLWLGLTHLPPNESMSFWDHETGSSMFAVDTSSQLLRLAFLDADKEYSPGDEGL